MIHGVGKLLTSFMQGQKGWDIIDRGRVGLRRRLGLRNHGWCRGSVVIGLGGAARENQGGKGNKSGQGLAVAWLSGVQGALKHYEECSPVPLSSNG